jgi:LysM repeat protein
MNMNIAQYLRMKRVLVVLLLAILLLLALTATTQAAPETAPPAQSGVYHTVYWGETLSAIAVRYGTTVYAIMAANPQIWNPNIIFAGQVLYIPVGSTPPPPPPPPPACRYYHYVNYGDTMYKISTWYGVSPWTIAQANNIYNLNLIYAGQVLCIP